MLTYAIIFLIVALIAAFLGFGGIAGTAATIAQVLFADPRAGDQGRWEGGVRRKG